MAQLKNKYFGELKGKLGDVVFRQRGKTNYITQQPRKYNRSRDPEHQNRINTFRLAIKLASAVNSISDLKEIWDDKSYIGSSTYNHLVSVLYPNLRSVDSYSLVRITPERSFSIKVKQIVISETQLDLNIEPLRGNSGINPDLENKARIVGVIWLYDPISSNNPKDEFTKFVSDYVDLDINNNIVFNLSFSSSTTELLKLYNQCRIYSSLITFTSEFSLVSFSNTFYADLSIRR
ncbi:MAG: hypothetical protein NZM09_04035 [Ignavibacterium sp.]|nr:hypothetical protein [Ignavibacterium sp.]MCX7612466.1 hypothetical protein [Ignavibacterium sp.]MDW8374846.1 hypothetical protein [Ignavibacteriales bacterium]